MKLKTILTLLAALGILTACNDDFFDQVPDDRITIEQVFQRTSYSEKYLATVYSYIRDESHRTDGVPWDPCSDDLDVTYDREDYNSFKMNLGNWSASSNYYEYWSHYYRGIRSATYFIQHIGSNQEMLDDPTRGPIVVEQYKNEARFLRAWFYYCLLRQYGPCVLLGDEVLPGDLDRDDVKMNLPRSSYDECVDYIVGELDDMIDNNRLPLHFTVQADKDYGRATLAMCMGLKSRVLLLAASDQSSGNADTIIVASYDTEAQKVGMVSVPRDTLLESGKINAAYHKGPENLRDTVSDLLGVPIDYYVAVDVDGFVALVDELGGIEFDVPVRMSFDDPTQDLHIHYQPGLQHLTGEDVLKVARCRNNSDGPGSYPDNLYGAYPDGDIGRTRTQQQLIAAILKKALSNPQKINSYVNLFLEYVDTDLEFSEALWFAQPALGLDFSTGFASATLAGENVYYVDSRGYRWGSCYELDPEAALETVNSLINPYNAPLTAADLNIFQKP